MQLNLVSIIRTIPLFLVCAFIFYMSSQDAISVSESQGTDIFIHKLAHVIEYAAVYISFYIAFYSKAQKYRSFATKGIIFVCIYGISDEIHQSFNPTRNPRYYDVLVDTLGGIIAAYFVYLVRHKKSS